MKLSRLASGISEEFETRKIVSFRYSDAGRGGRQLSFRALNVGPSLQQIGWRPGRDFRRRRRDRSLSSQFLFECARGFTQQDAEPVDGRFDTGAQDWYLRPYGFQLCLRLRGIALS